MFVMNGYNKILPALLFIIMCIIFTSCNNTGRSMFKADNGLRFDTVSIAKQYHLESDTVNPSCNIDLFFVYPVESAKMPLPELQKIFVQNVFGFPYDSLTPPDAAKKYVQNYIDNYINDARTYSESADEIARLNTLIPDLHVEDSENDPGGNYFTYFEMLSDTIVYDKYDVLAFQVRQSNRKGGAESYNSYHNYVMNLKTGELLTENDIFNPGYDKALQTLFATSLMEQNGVKTVSELEDLGFFGVDEIAPNRNFLVDEKGITYIFNKGEYSAYQLAAPVIFIPYSSVRSLLRENTVITKLAGL